MPYLANSDGMRQQMLKAVGLAHVDELFRTVPEHLRYKGHLDIPPAITELELSQHVSTLADRNRPAGNLIHFMGAGAYDHYIPSAIDPLASRGEYLTSYTPYQAEASQGTLQVMYEYQTLIAELTGMEIANASLYDGTSAAAEAALMAANITRRSKVLVSQSVHPEIIECLKTYLVNTHLELVPVPYREGRSDLPIIAGLLDDQTACVITQSPNFFGIVEETQKLVDMVHAAGALSVVHVDPISLGLLEAPGDYDADIAIGEGQSLGIPMQMGGPYLGFMATRRKWVRQLPGRLCARTTDRNGNEAYCLTLQTREQHIRREKATSNICTNEGLMMVRAMLYLSLLGAEGLREVATLCASKARYLADELGKLPGFKLRYEGPFFKEFVLECEAPADRVLARLEKSGIIGGIPLLRFYPQMENRILVAVTEKRTRAELDMYVQALRE